MTLTTLTRWVCASGLALGTPAASRGAAAAEVALVKSNDVPSWRPAVEALQRVVSGQTVTEYDMKGLPDEAARVADQLKAKPAETIVVAMGPLAAQTIHEALPDRRLVFCMVQEPAKLGLLDARGVTGVAFLIPLRNQLAAFRMVNPGGGRIGLIYSKAAESLYQEAAQAAQTMGVGLVAKPVSAEKDVPKALRSLVSGSDAVDALWLLPDAVMLGDDTRRFVLSETLKAGRPVYGFSDALIPEGALVTDGPDLTSIGEQVGELVNRLAGGEKGRIEMLMPRAELVVNKKIAGKLQVEIPNAALRAASRVY